jgi:hypothetical protein
MESPRDKVPDPGDGSQRPRKLPTGPEAGAGDFDLIAAYVAAHPDEWSLTHEDPEDEQFPPPGFRWATSDGREPTPDRDCDETEDSTGEATP